MLTRFLQYIEEKQLVPQGATILVGYSGGADSTCLLHLLHEAKFDIIAAHLHHGQREEAEKELKLCQGFCEELGIPFIGGRADVPRMADELKIGLEEAGRKARYQFFEQAAFETQCSHIATAHTQTDHVETILMNIVRGAGMSGLTGIPEVRGNIIRPLLCFSRDDTQSYCDKHGFWYHNDPANIDISFSRARLRLRVLPELRSINEKADEAISRLAEIVTEEDSFLNGMAAAALEQSEIKLNGELHFLTMDIEAAFDQEKLLSLPPVLFKRALRLATSVVGGALNQEQTLLALKGIAEKPTGSITVEGGNVAIEWKNNRVHIRNLSPTVPFRHGLEIPGEVTSDEFGWQFTAVETKEFPTKQDRKNLKVFLDKALIKGQLYFRTVKPGDTLQPLGFEGTRKVSDLLSEAKLTLAARNRLPIVCDMVGPVWIPGVCLSERLKPTEATSTSVELQFCGI